MATWTRICFYCKNTFEAAHSLANICSPECRDEARASRVRSPRHALETTDASGQVATTAAATRARSTTTQDQTPTDGDEPGAGGPACPRCGTIVRDETATRKYCSRTCRRAALRKRRKAMIRSAYVEPVSLAVLRGRDADTCRICGQPVDFTKQSPDPGSATIDHVVPLARGGSHGYDNTQLAHLRCNSEKGAGAPVLPRQVAVDLDQDGWAPETRPFVAGGDVVK